MTNRSTFSYKEALKFGFNKVLDNAVTVCLITFVYLSFFALLGIAAQVISRVYNLPFLVTNTITLQSGEVIPYQAISLIWLLAYYVIFIPLTVYWYYVLLNIGIDLYKGKDISVGKAFSYSIGTFFKFFGARLLMGLKFFLGLILLIIPGFYFLTKYLYAGFSIIDNPTLSIKEDAAISRSLTHHNKWRLLGVLYIEIAIVFIFNFIIPASIFFTMRYFSVSMPQMLPAFFAAGIYFLPFIFMYLAVPTIMCLVSVHIYMQLKASQPKVEASE